MIGERLRPDYAAEWSLIWQTVDDEALMTYAMHEQIDKMSLDKPEDLAAMVDAMDAVVHRRRGDSIGHAGNGAGKPEVALEEFKAYRDAKKGNGKDDTEPRRYSGRGTWRTLASDNPPSRNLSEGYSRVRLAVDRMPRPRRGGRPCRQGFSPGRRKPSDELALGVQRLGQLFWQSGVHLNAHRESVSVESAGRKPFQGTRLLWCHIAGACDHRAGTGCRRHG
jgi:hypothetical protein